MLKLITRNGFIVFMGNPWPAEASVPVKLVLTPLSGTGLAPCWSEKIEALPGPPPEAPKSRPAAAKGSGDGQVWVLVDGQPQAVTIKTGVSNGRLTEVLGGDLPVGAAVISDYQAAKK